MTAERTAGPAARSARMLTLGRWVVVVAAVVVVTLVVGGYGMGWRWTGLSRAVTLWDWMQALLLPLALGMAPVLLLHRRRLRRRHHVILVSALAAFALLIVVGYLVPLVWTGFRAKTLWDWFGLTLLPLVVTATPIWVRADEVRREHLMVAALAVLVFAGFVVEGYTVPLGWTGFVGNTAWDWLKLLLLPVLLPTVVIPLLSSTMLRALVGDDQG
ncbi:hypothetical protein [Amnibacterium sp.]|uniref:hypothetical protein n=1 Tax=Amnibacterium sp. TaxID=1872496 RepID=UPI002613F14B|nr:hypothetical protein [Amnibacterium sp.]MCU1472268.1 hypothetical protein [Amnibacterium sp.]